MACDGSVHLNFLLTRKMLLYNVVATFCSENLCVFSKFYEYGVGVCCGYLSFIVATQHLDWSSCLRNFPLYDSTSPQDGSHKLNFLANRFFYHNKNSKITRAYNKHFFIHLSCPQLQVDCRGLWSTGLLIQEPSWRRGSSLGPVFTVAEGKHEEVVQACLINLL